MPSALSSLLRTRELGGGWGRVSRRSLMGAFRFVPQNAASMEVCNPFESSKVAICLAYNSDASGAASAGRNLLGIACEEGYVTIVDATRPSSTLPTCLESQASLARWQAHRNLIHQLCWAKGDTRMYTACGDTTTGIWDTATAQLLACCAGHGRAVKSVSLLDAGGDVFASGKTVFQKKKHRKHMVPVLCMHVPAEA
ncbi:hypothetical protein DUNSADRAFT_11864 [Dunaliella salina]|uniref:Uncharacterized protein n=1 Tax=Dunaliella salina TaxID=3046 RepID=A0ABQ7H479_DUNSA|nr:hypothetical protein DUNSADRAFT_11864 [Dunaliella salina]|eukprot:KAF5841657.1 hypothetical protein DUNSADRAFT_11864 [Dunaliella salina]